MQLYLAIAVRAFRRATTYRSAYVAGILTNAFFGALISFVYQAVYQSSGVVAGFSLNDAISYTWATQSLIRSAPAGSLQTRSVHRSAAAMSSPT
jgi:ABC-2 type transport system permease protein